MSRVWAWILAVVGVAAVTIGLQIFFFAQRHGGFVEAVAVEPPGGCRTVAAPVGIEDLAIDRARGLAFLSSDDRRASAAGNPVDGGIYVAILDSIDEGAIMLLTDAESGVPSLFHPHGMSLWIGPDGSRTLFVVNHRRADFEKDDRGHTVEIFDVIEAPAGANVDRPVTLKHRRTIESPLFRWPNDVAATGPDSFFATNSVGSGTTLGVAWEFVQALERSNVVFFDGTTARVAADGLGFANGIALSNDGATLYVTETGAKRLSAYARDAQSGSLTLANRGFFGTGLDNIDVAPDGELWIGSHPNLIAFLRHAGDPARLSPSLVLRVEPQPGGAARAFYAGEGRLVSGLSVAAVYRGEVVAGSVYERKLLICRLQPAPNAAP